MKKLVIAGAMLGLLGAGLSATPADQVESALQRAISVQNEKAAQKQFARLTQAQQAQFEKWLPQAAAVMLKNDLDPADLGAALASSIPEYMIYAREAQGPQTELYNTPQELRAALYAIHVMLPAQYRKEVLGSKEYEKLYPVQDWAKYRQQCQQALEILYTAVQAIAQEQMNFQYTYLKVLTH